MTEPTLHTRTSFVSRYFSFLERRTLGDRLLFHVLLALAFGSLLLFVITQSNVFTHATPVAGGDLVEGVVGTPRFVNPILAVTRADQDMVALVYSGLMKIDTEGNLVPNIAESVTRSDDGLQYHVKLRQDVYFHNGTQLTAKDVAYTIGLIQNPELKSPLRGNWDGVTITEDGDYELTITLAEAYTPFIENLAVGILPRAIWETVPIEQLPFSQYNTEPIGTGAYYVDEVVRDKTGLIGSYVLKIAPQANPKPNIARIVMRFYQNEQGVVDALAAGEIGGTPSLSPESLLHVDLKNYTTTEQPLPRTFGLFFNQNKSTALLDAAVREALDIAIDRTELVQTVTEGHGIPTDSPVPPGFLTVESTSTATNTALASHERIIAAKKILADAGWKQNANNVWEKQIDKELVQISLTISTGNTPLFEATANDIALQWKALGVDVTIDQYEQTDLVQSIIRPRNFQVLLFGNDVSRALDLYPFWHSSQKDDPGLNITQYTSIEADTYLTTIRTAKSIEERDTAIRALVALIKKERPAIFLFSPTFTYVQRTDVSHPPFIKIGTPSDRLQNIAQWYSVNERLWPVFQ